MKKNIKKQNRGFTLVETLVSIAIFTLAVIGMMSVLSSGISNTTYAKQKMIASYLAQEGIEYVRNVRDTDVLYGGSTGWATFKTALTSCTSEETGCSFDTVFPYTPFIACGSPAQCELYVNNLGGYDIDPTGNPSGFTREVWMVPGGTDDEVKIFSKVQWTQGSGVYNITFSENLYNWYGNQ